MQQVRKTEKADGCPLDEKKIADLQKRILFYETILDSIRNGVMITDRRGKVIFFSKAYGEFLGIKPEETIGKHCTEVIENTRMHIVAETGVPEINHAHSIRGQEMVVQRIPIRIDRQGLFVFGQVMFKDVRDVHTLSSRLSLLESKVEFYERELTDLRSSKYTLQHIVGNSKGVSELKKLALRAAEIDAPVLITGESGTGKELFAHAIHYASKRRLYPFIRLNCSAIPKELLEAELFGYEPGAFTGASHKGKAGKFELAHGGSIFLDEIGDLPMEMQPKLLRVLEEKEFEHLGGNHLIKSNFRLIAATHENLEDLVARGKFRKDLFYRLNVIPISILPLRERIEDLPLIAEYLMKKLSREHGTKMASFSPAVMQIFQSYPWPGNVRELSNILERILFTLDGDQTQVRHLPLFMQDLDLGSSKQDNTLLKRLRDDMEKETLMHTIRISNFNKNKAARLLGIHRTSLYKKMKKLNISLKRA
ncbi:MAG: sigma 54-interacting transcriptional regulator [Deltaproteobacteria bacterium]|nr:sigma 54-interacting transcriptional regulator [Deltaproteobacteria bacterium]